MRDKICIVTGANIGIGKVTALELARMGATVVMVCRNKERGERAAAEIVKATGNRSVSLIIGDMSSQKEIRNVAAKFREQFDALHVLVNNAGGLVPTRTTLRTATSMKSARTGAGSRAAISSCSGRPGAGA